MQQERKLPIGVQSFEVLRNDGYVYVDKTILLYELSSMSTPFFLSRPRRFGKSLLLSTFEAYFEGRKDLFAGLAIEKLEEKWEKYPVLHLDLNAEKYSAPESLQGFLSRALSLWEEQWGRDENEVSLAQRFAGIIRRAYEKEQKRVVVLIDEYDKPMLEAILDESLSDAFRKTLKAFYGVLKSAAPYLRFVFITGVTKFAQVSVFSDLNQLVDISMVPQFAEICGITKQEMFDNFQPELKQLSANNKKPMDEMVGILEHKYDGYHFFQNTLGLFNPFSLLHVLRFGVLKDYWFATGTPTYLVDLLKQSDYDLRLLVDGVRLAESEFSEYRADIKNPIPMIYQSGYLTIKDYNVDSELYTLGFPNEEVRFGFMKFLVPYYTKEVPSGTADFINTFAEEVNNGEIDAFIERVKVFFEGIPYDLNNKNEWHYQAIFYVLFTLLGHYTTTEVKSARGRADAIVKTKNYIYVFEFKLDGSADDALKQIDSKGYLIPYSLDGRKLVKVGVDFDKDTHNIREYRVG